jgi:eukaryotic-like serine/threonine-protein kinase
MVTEAPTPKKSSEGLIGQLLANRYQIEYKLGEGAMGAVFRAHHAKFGRPFAVKVLHPKLLDDKKLAMRFEREAELAGRLRHPNVIGVVDVGETPDGLRYMVMDFVQGADLAEILQEAPMPPERIIPLVRQMLEGLYHAHEAGLIHRDFKPENVIVERDDHGKEVPRIVDFGIAILREGSDSTDSSGRLTTNGLVLGTPHYMAPEQAVADPIDHRIDLFAMGIVVYEMLSGMLPFDGSGAEVARANLLLDPPPISHRVPGLEVDPLLEAFARRLMAKRRDQRPATAKAARELLDMIERDRAAAAAALGVPLDIGTRPPQATQPMEPLAAAALVGPPGVPASRSSALEGPPMSQPQAAVAPATAPGTAAAAVALGTQSAPTTAMAEPLPWSDGARPSKRRWLIAGGVGVAAAGALIAAALGIFGGADEKQPEAPPSAVAATANPAAPAAPAPPAAAPPVTAGSPAAPSEAAPQPGPESAAAVQPAVDPDAQVAADSTKPAPTQGRPTKTHKAAPSELGPAKPGSPGSKVAKPDKTKPDEVQSAPPRGAAAKASPPAADPAASGDALQKEWWAVRAAIDALDQTNRSAATTLRQRWTLINILDAMGTPDKRRAAAAKLADLRRLIAEASKK